MNFRSILFVAGLTLAGGMAQPGPQEAGTITVVTRDILGVPIPGVSLLVTKPPNAPSIPGTLTTDQTGRVVLSNLPDGRYTLRAGPPNGYVALLTNNALGTASATIEISPGQRSHTVTLEFVRSSEISGRVLGTNGGALPGVVVIPMRKLYQNGLPTLSAIPLEQRTNALGEYRITGLPRGEYYLRVQNANPAGAGLFTYFPGTTNSAAAAPVLVRENENLTGIDIRAREPQGVTISGTVAAGISGGCSAGQDQGPGILTFYIIAAGTGLLDRTPTLLNNIAPAPTENGMLIPFRIQNVPSGAWYLYPFCRGADRTIHTASIRIDVADEAIEGLASEIRPNFQLHGKVLTKTSSVNLSMESLTVRLEYREPLPTAISFLSRPNTSAVAEDGTFTIPGVRKGRYSVVVSGLPEGMHVLAVRIGPRPFDNHIIEVDSESTNLELTVDTGAAALQGTVLDRERRALAGASVVLIPQQLSQRENSSLYKSAVTNSAGQFFLPNVPPGDYKVFAWDRLPDGRAYENSEFMNAYENRGKSLTFRPGSSPLNVEVDVIPGPR